MASQGIIKYCLRGLLGSQQRKALFMFLNICSRIFAEKQSLKELHQLLVDVNTALAVLERDMPVTIQVRLLNVIKAMF